MLASVEIVNGAISDLLVLSVGEGYNEGESDADKDWIVPESENPGSGFKGYVKVSIGVLEELQTVENGAIGKPGTDYFKVLNQEGFVRIFDYNKGHGASGFVSKLDENGGITEITITNGGEEYNSLDKNTSVIYILPSYNGLSHEGYGFVSNFLQTRDGVPTGFEILESGSNL